MNIFNIKIKVLSKYTKGHMNVMIYALILSAGLGIILGFMVMNHEYFREYRESILGNYVMMEIKEYRKINNYNPYEAAVLSYTAELKNDIDEQYMQGLIEPNKYIEHVKNIQKNRKIFLELANSGRLDESSINILNYPKEYLYELDKMQSLIHKYKHWHCREYSHLPEFTPILSTADYGINAKRYNPTED